MNQTVTSRSDDSGAPRRELSLTDIVLFNVIATLGVQWIASSAHVGPVAILLHVLAVVFFFVPCVVVVSEFGRRMPEAGGFYRWTRDAFGEGHAFLCGWCWWLSVLLYLPGLLLTAAATATQAFGPTDGLSHTGVQTTLALLILWCIAGLNITGLRFSALLNNAAAVGLYSGGALALLASIVTAARYGVATDLTVSGGLTLDRLSLWAQIAFAYTGLELGTLMAGEVRDPQRAIPRAAWFSAFAVTGAYILGAWSLMAVMTPDEIDPMTGLVQVARTAGERNGAPWLGLLTGCLLTAGFTGKASAWANGAARLPSFASNICAFEDRFFRLHPRYGTPHKALVWQAGLCSLFIVVAQAGESLRTGWQVLMDMSIVLTFVPFVYIFACAWKAGMRPSGLSGMVVTLAALSLALIPPSGAASFWSFELKVLGGSAFLAGAGWLLFSRLSVTPR